jgi:hypothetical protein
VAAAHHLSYIPGWWPTDLAEVQELVGHDLDPYRDDSASANTSMNVTLRTGL